MAVIVLCYITPAVAGAIWESVDEGALAVHPATFMQSVCWERILRMPLQVSVLVAVTTIHVCRLL